MRLDTLLLLGALVINQPHAVSSWTPFLSSPSLSPPLLFLQSPSATTTTSAATSILALSRSHHPHVLGLVSTNRRGQYHFPHGRRAVIQHQAVVVSTDESMLSLFTKPRTGTIKLEPTASTKPWTTMNTAKYGPDLEFAHSTTPEQLACTSYVLHGSDIEGRIPADLHGTFYKNGPGNLERQGRRYAHVLDGDGFVAAFSIDGRNNRVRYTGRFVETEYYLQEKEENRILFRNVFGTERDGGMLANAFDVNLKNVANTNVMAWGGRLYALWEGGRPYELDQQTLQTLPYNAVGPLNKLGRSTSKTRALTIDHSGPIDDALSFGRSFTAHPHIVPEEDILVGFKSGNHPLTDETLLEFVEYDRNWSLKQDGVKYKFPEGPVPHDFSIAEDYYCFFQNRLSLSKVDFLLGIKPLTETMLLKTHQPAVLHIVPRRKDIHSRNAPGEKPKAMTFEIPYYFNMHNVPRVQQTVDPVTGHIILTLYTNGWNLRDERFFPASAEKTPFLGQWDGLCPDFESGKVPPAHLYRTVVDLTEGRVMEHEQIVEGLVMEFPMHDEDDKTTRPTHVYAIASSSDNQSLPSTGICRVDLSSNSARYWWAEDKIFAGEAIPVCKRNGQPGCWIITMLHDSGKRCATLAILDGERLEDGPVARVPLRHHITYGLHGCFAPED